MMIRVNRLLCVLLTVALLLSLGALPASAEETVKEWNGWRYRTIFDGERVEIAIMSERRPN